MKHVSIIVPPDGALSNIEFPRQVFTEVNQYLQSIGKEPVFQISMVALSPAVKLNNGLFTIHADATVYDLAKTDLIIIPALFGDMRQNVEKSRDIIQWIKKQHRRGAEVASLCVGAFLLAATGLVNNRKCATHWKAANLFRCMFPEVNLVKDKMITDENGIYSSGGGISFINLLVYLVEKYAGRETAVYCSKFFHVDIERSDQSPFIIFQGQKAHTDEPVRRAQEFIENNFQQKIRIDQLAGMVTLGRRSLERRFKKATSNTLNEYIQRVKIEAAKKYLEASDRKINDIMYEVGYSDTKTFRTSFKMVTGLLPNQYRSKYNKSGFSVER